MKLPVHNLVRKEKLGAKNRNALLSMSSRVVTISLTLAIAAYGGGSGGTDATKTAAGTGGTTPAKK